MKGDQSNHTDSRWQKTPVANLVRHVQSGSYYARIRVRGKVIWKPEWARAGVLIEPFRSSSPRRMNKIFINQEG
ncbi:MAG TPA: hypothetical protein VMR33_01740 [Candidatus Baltobacteraceae bacterium]|jgi:hypothetical protein|nr:hypothetical protein [Candidatus Baltobacteraceae bacterium]